MAGHSHAKTIKYRKNGQDVKRSKMFTRIQREISIAVKVGGSDEKLNPKLRLAKQKARLCNMPNDKINDAIKRASSWDLVSKNYEECYYLVSASGGAFILVKSLTDNKNRSASEVRGIVNKYGASIAESSGIGFLFQNVGVIKYIARDQDYEKIFASAINFGADDVNVTKIIEETEEGEILHDAIEVLCEFKNFNFLKTGLEEAFGEPKIAELEWRSTNKIEVIEDQKEKLQKIIDELDELEDVSTLYTNFEVKNDYTE